MDIMLLINLAMPIIVILVTQVLKLFIRTRWAPLIVVMLGGVATLVGVGPNPGPEFVDKLVNTGLISGLATLIYDLFKNMKAKSANQLVIVLMIGCVAMSLPSCSTMQSGMGKLGEMDLANADASRKLAQDLLKSWKLNSGFIRGALGDKIHEFPWSAITGMEELDALAEKTDLTDYDLGYSLGVRVRMLNQVVMEAIKIYAPDILTYLPSLLAL